MATYRVQLQPYARRELERLPEPARTRVMRAIRSLAMEPRPAGAKLLAGTKRPTWRIRIGDYRVLYEVDADQLMILVIGAGHRRDVYRHRRISDIAATRYADPGDGGSLRIRAAWRAGYGASTWMR